MQGLGYDAEMWVTRVLTCVALLAVGAAFIAALVAAARARKDGTKTIGLWLIAGSVGVSALNGVCFFGLDLADPGSEAYMAVATVGMLVEIAVTVVFAVGLLMLKPPDHAEAGP